MIDFLGAPLILRIALRVVMATMHFHVLAQTGLFLGNIFFISGGGGGVTGNNLTLMKNWLWGCNVG